MATALGVPRSLGQIYGLLYASPDPLTFSDIVAWLDISKGSVSQGLGLLKVLGAINEVEPHRKSARGVSGDAGIGGRSARALYEPELSLRRLVSGLLRERVAPFTANAEGRLAELRQLAKQDGRNQQFYISRTKQLEGWRRQLKMLLPVIGALLGPTK